MGQQIWITGCVFQGVGNPSQQYIEMAKTNDLIDNSEIIYTPDSVENGSFFITSSGGTLLPFADLNSDCSIYREAQSDGENLPFVGPNMVREACLANSLGSK